MKKTYIAPGTEVYKLKVESLLNVNSLNNEEQAGTGSESTPANFSRGGRGFFDDGE